MKHTDATSFSLQSYSVVFFTVCTVGSVFELRVDAVVGGLQDRLL